MPRVRIELPSMLGQVLGGVRSVPVEAASLRDALAALVQRHPGLAVHLFDESGGFREHVLCFHNDVNTRWLKSMPESLRDGDVITIVQAVSGG